MNESEKDRIVAAAVAWVKNPVGRCIGTKAQDELVAAVQAAKPKKPRVVHLEFCDKPFIELDPCRERLGPTAGVDMEAIMEQVDIYRKGGMFAPVLERTLKALIAEGEVMI